MAVHFIKSAFEPADMIAATPNAEVTPTTSRKVFIRSTCAETQRRVTHFTGAEWTYSRVPWDDNGLGYGETVLDPLRAKDAALALWALADGDTTFRDIAVALWWAGEFTARIPQPPDLDNAETEIREVLAMMPRAGEVR